MADLTVALVGCGHAGSIHLRCWADQIGVRIAAVCDADGIVAARTAAQIEVAAAFVDYHDLLAMDAFDIVDVCTPPDTQFAIAQAALQSGANVLCETPFTGSPEEAAALVRLAVERERLLMPVFSHRFHPPLLFARDLVESDDLGHPTLFRCYFSNYQPENETEAKPQFGALMDTALHGIDLFRAFCGEIVSVSGKVLTVDPNLTVEDTAAVLLEGRGTVGVVEATWSVPGGRNIVEIYGTAGACIVDYDAGTLRYVTADQPVWRHHEEGGPNGYERAIAHFADAVRGLQPLAVTGVDGARAVAICAEVYHQNGS